MLRQAVWLLGVVVIVSGGTAQASISNTGFETGDTTGWTVSDPIISSVQSNLKTGQRSFFPNGGHLLVLGGPPVNFTPMQTVSQTGFLNAGESVGGSVAAVFNTGSAHHHVTVHVHDSNGQTYIPFDGFSGIGPVVPPVGWSFTAPTSGNYTIEYGVSGDVSGLGPTYGIFDDGAITMTPEPASMTLGVLGALGLMSRWIRKRQTA